MGVMLYEFMCGYCPFGDDENGNEDPYDIYKLILKGKFSFPDYMKDEKAKKLMKRLLSPQPEVRLGGSYADLKCHKWFKNVDFVNLFISFINFYIG